MTKFKQSMEEAGLRPVDFRNLVEELTGYRPPAATVSRWMHMDEDQPRERGAYDYAVALVRLSGSSGRAVSKREQDHEADRTTELS